MIRVYNFNYDFFQASATIVVNTNLFSEDLALIELENMKCTFDRKANPIDELMKKYAIEVIKSSTFNNYDTNNVIKDFKRKEYFSEIDGSKGIKLTHVSPYSITEEYLAFELICSEK